MSAPLASGDSRTQRPAVIQLTIKEKAALVVSYIPAFSNGGLFIPSMREHKLGDDIYILLTLPNSPERYPVVGKVAWITPAGGTKAQGVGIAFPKDEKANNLKARIEEVLGALLNSETNTQTF